jgi:murein DD-endopeptidase MepM/ murein hydrolase activator NlpD
VQKRETIALSGNTGSSEGPHLHFEFRDSKTEKVINPLLFGFDKHIKDTKSQSFQQYMFTL